MNTQRQFSSRFGISIEIGQGDITAEPVDAIVNAANSLLMHGGGVARAIAEAGGEIIDRESQKWIEEKGPVTHQSPAFTSAGKLPCKYVIHAVGPVWGEGGEEGKLASAIRETPGLMEELGVKSLRLAISLDILDFRGSCCKISWMNYTLCVSPKASRLKLIKIVLFDDRSLSQFTSTFDLAFGQKAGE